MPLDEGASLADQRKILDKLTPEAFRDGVTIDDAVKAPRRSCSSRAARYSFLTGTNCLTTPPFGGRLAESRMSLEPIHVDEPAGTLSLVAQQLALGLATIWKDWTGQDAKRSVRT